MDPDAWWVTVDGTPVEHPATRTVMLPRVFAADLMIELSIDFPASKVELWSGSRVGA